MSYPFNCTRMVPSFGPMRPATQWLYEPPASKAETHLRSWVNLQAFRDLEEVAKSILGEGRRVDGQICTPRITVELVGRFVPEIGRYLQPGAWFDRVTGCIGEDPYELLAYLNGGTYRWAIEVIAERFGLNQADCEDTQPQRLDDWVQERNPLNVPIDSQRIWLSVPPSAQSVSYRNAVGTVIGQVTRWKCLSGEEVTLHRTLRRHRKGVHPHWMEVFHQQPYPLFNADQLRLHPEKAAFFLADEFLATERGEHAKFVFSAIPGGLANLPDADLSNLADRSVHVVMDDEVLRLGKVIEKKLREAGVQDAKFCLCQGGSVQSFENLEAIAEERGVELLSPPTPASTLKIPEPMDFEALMDFELPDREFVISPILQQQGLGMIHAPRGVGKTFVALGLSVAAATGGSFLSWSAPKPQRVLYLDGEMPAAFMQDRLKAIAAGMGTKPASGFFRLLNPDLVDGPMPDISTDEGQAAIEPYLKAVELIVLDNLSTLCRSGRENDSSSWGSVQSWLLSLRRRGIAVLIVHHSGKNGKQRDTSKREDVLDIVLNLRRPLDYSAEDGARFEVHVEKGRSLFGTDAKPFEACLEIQDGLAIWTVTEQHDQKLERLIEMLRDGCSYREIEVELGIPKSTVGRWKQQLIESGELEE